MTIDFDGQLVLFAMVLILGGAFIGLVVHMIRGVVRRWFQVSIPEAPPPPEPAEEEEIPPPPPPPAPPRAFAIGEVLMVTRIPFPKVPRDHGMPLILELDDQLIRGMAQSWRLRRARSAVVDVRMTDLTDQEMAHFLRTGHVRFGPQTEPLMRTVAAPPVMMRTMALSVPQNAADRRDVYAKAPVVRLLKDEPRTSRYDRILDEDEDENAPGVHLERKDP